MGSANKKQPGSMFWASLKAESQQLICNIELSNAPVLLSNPVSLGWGVWFGEIMSAFDWGEFLPVLRWNLTLSENVKNAGMFELLAFSNFYTKNRLWSVHVVSWFWL